MKKKRPEDEINIHKLPPRAKELFTQKGGSREKEWKSIKELKAVIVHRGKAAAEIRRSMPDRIAPSRWHEKWKDQGDEFNNGLGDDNIPAHFGAKS